MAQSRRTIDDQIKALMARKAVKDAKANRAKEIKSHQAAIARLRKAK